MARKLRYALLGLLLALPLSGTAQAAVPPTPPGWTLAWSDDFTGPNNSAPNANNWIVDTGHGYPGGPGNWGTGEIQRYTNDRANLRLDGTGALGYWPAFWALGAPYRGNYWNWPSIGEFDIMENVNGINSVWGVLHCGVNPGGPCNETNGLGASRACPGSACQSAFHTYRFEWDRSVSPNQLRWYVDGQQFHTVRQNQMDATTWNNMTSHQGYFILLNVAMGGAFPNGVAGRATPTPQTTPGRSMAVDYVAVWTRP
ncbi:family 16 glycosylhydrolase [Lentzea flava]|uniref:GH16 domain-containing protein n=1 Tax=Lentzea flava TaxID=103732 RepID=A0ABQ2UW40_9PSEU|nr:family 16 glycosylhydrolase [Lentzea flava]MCP2201987.1 Glycosyl hydrolases family 16 [Lentzea flava]GGU54125.1 hypothetical protein GCM10010178_53220 [Lentzea flava]